MKRDTQHLDFLISQYIDGCLDLSSKKSLEQSLVNDPHARKLYKEQREVQDVLDDWGNRIALINWEQFDAQLAHRIANESVGSERRSFFQRWAKPASIAASLLLAATLGYGWHAFSTPNSARIANDNSTTRIAHPVNIANVEGPSQQVPARRTVTIDERGAQNTASSNVAKVEITSPDEYAARDSLMDAVRYGLGNQQSVPGTATTFIPAKEPDKEKPTESALPYP